MPKMNLSYPRSSAAKLFFLHPVNLSRGLVHSPASGCKIDENDSVLHACRKYRQAGRLRSAYRHARLKIEMPPVQWADDGRPGYDAVAQRPASVRTRVFDRQEPAVQIEDRDLEIADPHRPPLARRNVLDARNLCPGVFDKRSFAAHTN